jgi:glycerol-3-phosphate acyltransferase PlsY
MSWIDQIRQANWSEAFSIGFGAYLLGCLTTGYYLMRFSRRQDVREMGSGSVGAKNVGRFLGWSGFIVTVIGDVSKGAFAVWAAMHFTKDDRIVALALLGVVAGHVWPVQLRFHGGKGIATSLGGLLIYDYRLVAAFAVFFCAAALLMRKTVVPGLIAFSCLPLASYYLDRDPARAVAISALSALVLVTHRRNLTEELYHFLDRRNLHQKADHTDI